MNKIWTIVAIVACSSIMQLQGAAEPSREQPGQEYRRQAEKLINKAQMLTPDDILVAGELLLQVKETGGKAEAPLRKLLVRIMQTEPLTPEIIEAGQTVLELLKKAMPIVTKELAPFLMQPVEPYAAEPRLIPAAEVPANMVHRLTTQIIENEQTIKNLQARLREKENIIRELNWYKSERDRLQQILHARPEKPKTTEQMLVEALQTDDADIVLFSIGSRGYETQEVPYFMKDLAEQFPDSTVRIYSISSEEKASSLSQGANANQFTRISGEHDLLARYRHQTLSNLEVITTIALLKPLEFGNKFDNFLNRKLQHNKFIVCGNNASYQTMPGITIDQYRSLTSQKTVQLYVQAGKGSIILALSDASLVESSVPVYEIRGEVLKPVLGPFVVLNVQGLEESNPLRFHLKKLANNGFELLSITGPFESIDKAKLPRYLAEYVNKGTIKKIR